MNIVTCGADNDFMNALIRGIILEMINEGTLQAQLLDCDGTPLGKNAKVLLCCEGDCDGGSEHKDTFVDKVTNEIEGGNHKITLIRNDGQSFVIQIPVTPAPAEDKYVTDFSLANRGGKPVLELRRSDNVVLTAHLPDNSGGGGSGTDDYVTSGVVTVQREKGGEGRKIYHANLKLTRKDGGEVDIDMDNIISTAMDNPNFDAHMELDNSMQRTVRADGYYVTAPERLRWTKDDSSPAAVVDLPVPALWYSPAGDGTTTNIGNKLLPIMDLHWGKPYGNNKLGLTKDALCYVKADGTQGWLEIPQAGSSGGTAGVTNIELSPTLYRHLQVTANGQVTNLKLPDPWFERKAAGSATDENVKNFVTVEEYNTLAANLAQLSWSAAIPHESFRLSPELLANFRVELLPALHNQYGEQIGTLRAADRSDWIKLHGNDVLVYPYQIISLFQAGDTMGDEATHLHRVHPYLHALIPSRDRDGAGPGTLNGTHAIDIFRQSYGVGLTGLQYAYAGTVYMSTVFMDNPAQEPPPGVYHSVFPINILNTTPMDKVANYSSIMPEVLWYRVRDLFPEETPTTVPSELIYNTHYNVKPHNSIPKHY